jgi:MoxR-like ATPase
MEERQVTSEGVTRSLPEPFFVVGTQNPTEQIGTFPLPESQLDRFLIRISMGYPPREAERALLTEPERRDLLAGLPSAIEPEQLRSLQQQVREIRTTGPLTDYLMALIEATRRHPGLKQGLSPRAGLALRRAAQAWALIEGHGGVIPEDVQAVFAAVAGHRLSVAESDSAAPIIEEILKSVAVP